MTDTPTELSTLREEIDRIDEGIGDLIAERIEVAERVAAAKRRAGTTLVDEDREATVEAHYADRFLEAGLPAERGRALASLLIDVSLERERAVDGDD